MKTIIITGGNSEPGSETVKHIARIGGDYELIISCRSNHVYALDNNAGISGSSAEPTVDVKWRGSTFTSSAAVKSSVLSYSAENARELWEYQEVLRQTPKS